MRIIFLTRLFWPHVGGVERHVQGLVQELVKNHEVTIITEQYSPDLKLQESHMGAQIFRIPVFQVSESQKKWTIWKWLWHHQDLLKYSDIIHVHDVVFWLYPYKLLHPNKKIFATFHGWEGVYPLPVKNILQRRLDAAITRGNICVGDYLAIWYGIKPDLITYGAVSPVPHVRKQINNSKKLLYLGRLDENTGWRECLARFHRLKSRNGWNLVVAGDGPLSRLAPTEAKLLGSVPNPFPYILASDYVFTSGYLSILEAFAAGKVVLSYSENPLKRDYLMGHPMAKFLNLDDNLPRRLPKEPQLWAKNQTWALLAGQYRLLWAK